MKYFKLIDKDIEGYHSIWAVDGDKEKCIYANGINFDPLVFEWHYPIAAGYVSIESLLDGGDDEEIPGLIPIEMTEEEVFLEIL